jgi:RNA polymerase sigma-70 factor, ECF subfamily
MQKDDKKLIEEFLAGKQEAFEVLLDRYLKPVYNFSYQLVRDATISEDLTQETFVKAWKNIKRFDKNRSFKTWVFTIAKNTTYDYFKKKKTIPFSSFVDEDGNNKLENLSDNNILLDEILERKNIAKEMEEKLKEIPEKYRIILTLHYREDFSLQEISEILGKPYNTIKSGHQRALKKMREVIANPS